jgi:ketosteroid isomerase-like protein
MPNPSASTGLEPAITPQIRAAIEALVIEHAWLIDHGQAGRLDELYTEDGLMTGLGPEVRGREAIRVWGKSRAAITERTSRHVSTNLRLQALAAGDITGHVILTVYRHDGEGMGDTTPFAIADYRDVYRRDGQSWRFAERHLTTVFIKR